MGYLYSLFSPSFQNLSSKLVQHLYTFVRWRETLSVVARCAAVLKVSMLSLWQTSPSVAPVKCYPCMLLEGRPSRACVALFTFQGLCQLSGSSQQYPQEGRAGVITSWSEAQKANPVVAQFPQMSEWSLEPHCAGIASISTSLPGPASPRVEWHEIFRIDLHNS